MTDVLKRFAFDLLNQIKCKTLYRYTWRIGLWDARMKWVAVVTGTFAAAFALYALVAFSGVFRAPVAMIVVLPTSDGKSTLEYVCEVKTSHSDAQERAEAAHAFFQSRLATLAGDAAKTMQAALEHASKTGDTSGILPSEQAYQQSAAALVAEVQSTYSCDVNLTVKN